MIQEKEASGSGTGLLKEEQINRTSFFLNHEEYQGEWKQGDLSFVARNGRGKELLVRVQENREDGEEQRISSEHYPHLHETRRMIKGENHCFILIDPLEKPDYEPLEEVLFGKGMSLTQRLLLSLSLAAAAAELEAVYEQIPVRQFSLEAFLVEESTCIVRIDCDELRKISPPEEIKRAYEKMDRLGLMPPEWYETGKIQMLSLWEFRHILAVLLFRALCASDPFDGSRTLREYPYKNRTVRQKMYGKHAEYILKPSGGNPAGPYMGARAEAIFSRVCPGLKRLFHQAFTEGIQDPEQRPSAGQWAENQKKMMSWYQNTGQDWRIPDLSSGNGTVNQIRYLCIENGTVLPVIPDKLICQYMFDPADQPLREKIIGRIHAGRYGTELVFDRGEEPPVILEPGSGNMEILGQTAVIQTEPWRTVRL